MKKSLSRILLMLTCVSTLFTTEKGWALNLNRNSSLLNKYFSASTRGTEENLGPITGTVKDDKGLPLQGVSVTIKGTTKGTTTDLRGRFSINTSTSSVLVFSFIGFTKKEIAVGKSTSLTVVLMSSAKEIGQIVVTALGIKKSERSLAYTTQTLSSKELTSVKTENMMNALNGKVPGINITPSAGGLGNGTKVILRGQRSIAGNNQPLYVIDGVPMSNNGIISGIAPNGTYGGAPDPGDGIGNLNPDDIESVSVLEGGPAAALYGSAAANGVVQLTTRKGSLGKTRISVSSLSSFSTTAYRPKFQNRYTQGDRNIADEVSSTSWGPKASFKANDNLKKFFQTGINLTNSISLSGGNEVAQTYFSFANTTARGIEPTNKLERNNLNLHETARFLNKKLTLDGNINFLTKEVHNNPNIGTYNNPLTGLYFFPRNRDITPYKNNYELPSLVEGSGIGVQNWDYNDDQQQNPWWIINKEIHLQKRTRTIVNISGKYDFFPWMSLQARGSFDQSSDLDDLKWYAGIKAPHAGAGNGMYTGAQGTQTQKYADAILTLHTLKDGPVKADGLIGTSIQDNSQNGVSWGKGSLGNGLLIPNIFTIQNIQASAANSTNDAGNTAMSLAPNHSQTQAVFASGNVSYKDWIFLSLTARNDWSSNLSYTSKNHYFYPSAGLSVILNQVLKLPKEISYWKVRASYAQVGNTVQIYAPLIVHTTSGTSITLNTQAPYPTLKPEKTNSKEIGTELRFFGDRLAFSFSYYESNTYNQSVLVSPPQPAGYATGYLNTGNVQNQGFEFLINYLAFSGKDFSWSSSLNGARNVNKIIDLDAANGINRVTLTDANSYRSVISIGGKFGDIWAQSLAKDKQGRILVSDAGGTDGGNTPMLSSDFSPVANATPKFQGGWSNDLKYKNLSLVFLIDAKIGGQVVSNAQQQMDFYGVTKETGDARDAGGVKVNAVDSKGNPVKLIDAQKYYQVIGGRNGALGSYVYDATVVHLRQLALGYTFPFKSKAIKALKLSLTGDNLLYLYKKAPFDPDLTSSTGNGLSGVDVFNMPALRTFGLNVNLSL